MSERIDVVLVLTGAPGAEDAVRALAEAWDDARLRRAVLVWTPAPGPLADLLAAVEEADIVEAPAAATFNERARLGLARVGTDRAALVSDDVVVGRRTFGPLVDGTPAGTTAFVRVGSTGPGTAAHMCWQQLGERACRFAPDHATGVLVVGPAAALAAVAAAPHWSEACGSWHVPRRRAPGPTAVVPHQAVDAVWHRRVHWPVIGQPVRALPGVVVDVRQPQDVEVGAHTYVQPGTTLRNWMPGERIVIGDYCSIANDCLIMAGGGHRTATVSTWPLDTWLPGGDSALYRSYQTSPDTVIGNDVWLGARALVGPGARIGDGAVVAAGAVVFGRVPPYAIVAGNPAKVVRYRFSPATIERLRRIAWWTWPEHLIAEHLDGFYGDVQAFCDRFDPVAGDGHPLLPEASAPCPTP